MREIPPPSLVYGGVLSVTGDRHVSLHCEGLCAEAHLGVSHVIWYHVVEI